MATIVASTTVARSSRSARPSGGQQLALVHRYDRCRSAPTQTMSRMRMPSLAEQVGELAEQVVVRHRAGIGPPCPRVVARAGVDDEEHLVGLDPFEPLDAGRRPGERLLQGVLRRGQVDAHRHDDA